MTHVALVTGASFAQRKKPGQRYRVGRRAMVLTTLKRLLPEPAFERISRRVFQPQPL